MRFIKYLRKSVVSKDERKPCILLLSEVFHKGYEIILNSSDL